MHLNYTVTYIPIQAFSYKCLANCLFIPRATVARNNPQDSTTEAHNRRNFIYTVHTKVEKNAIHQMTVRKTWANTLKPSKMILHDHQALRKLQCRKTAQKWNRTEIMFMFLFVRASDHWNTKPTIKRNFKFKVIDGIPRIFLSIESS